MYLFKKIQNKLQACLCYGLSLSFYQSGSVPFLAALAMQERSRLPRGSRHGGKDTSAQKLWGEKGLRPRSAPAWPAAPQTVCTRAPGAGLREASGPCPRGHLPVPGSEPGRPLWSAGVGLESEGSWAVGGRSGRAKEWQLGGDCCSLGGRGPCRGSAAVEGQRGWQLPHRLLQPALG